MNPSPAYFQGARWYALVQIKQMRLVFKPRDVWIGLTWNRYRLWPVDYDVKAWHEWKFTVQVIPMLQIQLIWWSWI